MIVGAALRGRPKPRACETIGAATEGRPNRAFVSQFVGWFLTQVWRVCVACVRELDLEPGGHAVEGFTVDAEDLRGALAVVAGGVEDVEDVTALDLIEIWQTGKKFLEIVRGERRCLR